MAIKKLTTGKNAGRWQADFYLDGRDSKRIKKLFSTKAEAQAFESFTLNETANKPWLSEKQDVRKLSELIDLWYSLYGQTLVQPQKMKNKLTVICNALGDPPASQVTAAMFSIYREQRLSGKVKDKEGNLLKPVKPKTINSEQFLLSGVFTYLKKVGHWKHENPLTNMPSFKIAQSELIFLADHEIKLLLAECANSLNKDLIHVVKICLSTGSRWSEAEELTSSQLTKYRITYTRTKNKKNRTVPISKELYDEIPKKTGRLFTPCRKAFERAVKRAGIQLPDGQCTHVLRHTFASHFMMNNGNILVLRDILGHSDITMTMIYAHFAPSHLEDAVTKNPLSRLK